MQRRALSLGALIFAVSALATTLMVRHAWQASAASDARWLAHAADEVDDQLATRVRCLTASVDALRSALGDAPTTTTDLWDTYATGAAPAGACRGVHGAAVLSVDPPAVLQRAGEPAALRMDDAAWLQLFTALDPAARRAVAEPVLGATRTIEGTPLALFGAPVRATATATATTSTVPGWVALLVSPPDLFQSLADDDLRVRIEERDARGRVLAVVDAITPEQAIAYTRDLEVGQRPLRLVLADARPAGTRTSTVVGFVSLLGSLQTIGLTWLVYTLAAARGRDASAAVERDTTPESVEPAHATQSARAPQTAELQVALQRSEQQYRRVVEQVEQVIFQVDTAGRWTFLNRAWTGLTGRAVETALGASMLDFIYPDDRHAAEALCTEMLAGRKDECQQDMRFVTDTGDVRWGAVQARPLSEHGVLLGVAGTISDVTARRQVQQELERARESAEKASLAKSEFLKSMSHEMRTPLNGVLGLMELLAGTRLDPQQARYVAVARASATQLSQLISDILDVSRLDAGSLELERTLFNLPDLVAGTLDVVSSEADKKHLHLSCTIEPEVPTWVIGDPGRLRQVIVNLLANSVKFTERGEVLVRAAARVDPAARAARVRIEVKDTGIGMSPELVDRLFVPFAPGDASITRRHSGSGLGLTICKRLVEAMQGTIAVQSVEHEGASVTIEVPMEMADAAMVESQRQDTPMRVLAVLPDRADRETIGQLLDGWRLDAVVVGDCATALGHLEATTTSRWRFGVVLLDGLTPNAASFARAIRELQRVPAVVWITPEDGRLPAEISGIREQIERPIKAPVLFDAIMQAVVSSAPGPADVARAPEWTRRLRVLVAEDHTINQMVVQELLQGMGCDVDLAANGEEAVDAVLARPYDVVLMDCQMPVLDGLEATRRIRRAHAEGRAPSDPRIIALTAYATDDDRRACLEAGMDAYLTKPLRGPVLQRTLQRLLGPDVAVAGPAEEPRRATEPATSETTTEPVLVEAPDLEDILDPAEILLRCHHNADLGARMLQLFAESLPAELRAMEDAAAANDMEALGRIAHKMRGAAATLAAVRLAGAVSGVELFLKYGDGGPLSELIGDVRHESALLLGAVPRTVRQLLGRPSTSPASPR